MMITPGTILGDRYEVIEKIGAGGMSIVYKAKCNRLQRFVAIKVLREEFVTDEEFVAKFRKEALAAASLSHPNIVGIYDVGSDQDLHYIVMEYVEGKTLKDLIAEEGPFDSKMVLEFGVQIVSALRHAHRKKIIHRDIKPQNILVTHDNVLKVTDFGIAKAVDSSTVVATGNAIGSVHYFSPEQAKGKYVNETSDLYSSGIVLFELATRKLPFEADSHISIALKHINEDLPLPTTFNPDVMPNLEKLILKATHKSQAARYQNADEMLKDMKGILGNPGYIVESNEVSDHTILLTDVETEYIRNNGNKLNKNTSLKSSSIYTEGPNLEVKEEEEEEISTLYKVLVSVGGVLATLVLISIITVALVVWLPGMNKSKEVLVPNLTGKTLEQAENLLKSYKLKLSVIGEEATDTVPEGTVFKQNPGENNRVKPNTVIEVTLAGEVTAEEPDRTIPDLIGLDRLSAEKLLNEYGLSYDIEGAYDNIVEVGKIMDQTPVSGGRISPETRVTLIVSKGPQVVLANVPNLANMTVQDAEISLRNEKLRLGARKEDYSDTVSQGLIISQTVSPNRQVEEGTAIDVVISKGKKEEVQPEPEETIPDTPKPSDNNVVTKIFTLANIPFDIETKDVYHVMIKLTTEDGSKIVFDQQVNKDQFPLNIPIKGKGKGTLDTYFDGKTIPSYQDEIDFNEV
ncbi:Stk1 family PASTA domain-containing Ser/Thr kinase [Cellulosilyticum sp. I15G10I2]|uniref:Stk1 family PASTA domain-containing Ser/Thr kinase n=1 Tax=Cellulosilyticum sp. I15G10I2 TaxID=1892843 RepID=UPI0009F736E2|nr:Stk1 family PASTA domain-containing Ser/Thr kinase [Cellulosilyticum sp. I15G10I2]